MINGVMAVGVSAMVGTAYLMTKKKASLRHTPAPSACASARAATTEDGAASEDDDDENLWNNTFGGDAPATEASAPTMSAFAHTQRVNSMRFTSAIESRGTNFTGMVIPRVGVANDAQTPQPSIGTCASSMLYMPPAVADRINAGGDGD